MGAFLRRHIRLVVAAGIVAIGLLVFVLVWFQPQKVIIEQTAQETFPPAATTEASAAPAPTPSVLGRGAFRSLEHTTTGEALLVRLADGSHVVRLEDLDTSNGPDVRIWLSTAPASANGREYAEDFVDLGAMKANRGDQNYAVPAGVDVERFRSVVVWCRRFTVGFGSAPLA